MNLGALNEIGIVLILFIFVYLITMSSIFKNGILGSLFIIIQHNIHEFVEKSLRVNFFYVILSCIS